MLFIENNISSTAYTTVLPIELSFFFFPVKRKIYQPVTKFFQPPVRHLDAQVSLHGWTGYTKHVQTISKYLRENGKTFQK